MVSLNLRANEVAENPFLGKGIAMAAPGTAREVSKLHEAGLASQLLAGGKVEKAVRLVVPIKDSPRGAEECERYDTCGHSTGRASRREHDSAPDCRR